MKISARFSTTIPRSANVVIVPYASDKEYALPKLSRELKSLLKKYIKTTEYTGKKGTVAFVQAMSGALSWVVLAGLGNQKKVTTQNLVSVLQHSFREAQKQGATSALVVTSESLINRFGAEKLGRLVAVAAEMGCYSFTKYKSKKSKKAIKNVTILTQDKNSVKALQIGIKDGQILGDATSLVRDYGNSPSNHITPKVLSEMAMSTGKATGQKVTIFGEKQMEKEKMGGILGVSRGSSEEAQFIILEHKLGKKGEQPVVLVGKGITFDSGGISIKPSAAMDEMKFDMSGGASVIGIMHAIGKMKLPVNVVGLVPASENVPSGTAYKPGDVLTYSDGTTVEVLNTDAEGRLILADALLYARKFNPKAIIDLATLTGAIVVALSDFATALFTNNDSLSEKLLASSENVGESLWRMPLPDEAEPRVKSKVADLQNISNKSGGGAITAAKFLEHFVKRGTPWAHLDIAATAWNTGETPGMENGATGSMVKTIVEYIQKNG